MKDVYKAQLTYKYAFTLLDKTDQCPNMALDLELMTLLYSF